jgi:hypothetical protein
MSHQFLVAEEFLADRPEPELIDDSEPELSAARGGDWGDIQRARAEYLREWEEDMRYAQELASEGMHG